MLKKRREEKKRHEKENRRQAKRREEKRREEQERRANMRNYESVTYLSDSSSRNFSSSFSVLTCANCALIAFFKTRRKKVNK